MTGYRLRTLRIQDCKKQGDVASYLNISRQYYSEYELGKRKMPVDVIIKLAKYYHTTTDYILGLDDVRGVRLYD